MFTRYIGIDLGTANTVVFYLLRAPEISRIYAVELYVLTEPVLLYRREIIR